MARKLAEQRISELNEQLDGLRSSLPEDEKESKCVARVSKKAAAEILDLECLNGEILECLNAQRVFAFSKGDVSPISKPKIDSAAAMSKRPKNRFYNVQRAFSLPSDYSDAPNPMPFERESEAIGSTVIHPELIERDFLVSLGLLSQSEPKQTYAESVREKISCVNALKEIFANGVPLPVNEAHATGRVLSIDFPDHQADGKAIVFQTETLRQEKRKERQVTSVRAFKDAYALSRSQQYASGFLEEREIALEIMKTKIAAILIEFSKSDADREKIGSIIEELDGKRTFYERRAYLDRLVPVRFRNRWQDQMRIKGAFNDAHRAFMEKVGKRRTIESQLSVLESIASLETNSWKTLYREFQKTKGNPSFVEKARSILRNLDGYDLSSERFSLHPFNVIRDSLSILKIKLKGLLDAKASEEQFSELMEEADLLLRSQAYVHFIFKLEHSLKTESIGADDYNETKEPYRYAIVRRIDRIRDIVLLGLTPEMIRSYRFTRYAEFIERLRNVALDDDFEELISLLGSEKSLIV